MSSNGQEGRLAAFRTLNAFFDRTYVLTIERNQKRRDLLEPVLEGLDFEYVFGIDGSTVPDSRLQADYDDAEAQHVYGRSLSSGQIGCTISHRMAYEDMVRNDHERALILEDDAFLPEERASTVKPVLDQLPSDWDLLYFFAERKDDNRWLDAKVRWLYPFLTWSGIRRYDMKAIRSSYSRPYSRNLRHAGKHWMALAYGITADTARWLIEYQTPVVTISDDALRTFCARQDTRAFLSTPDVFVPRGLDSTIWNRAARDHVKRW